MFSRKKGKKSKRQQSKENTGRRLPQSLWEGVIDKLGKNQVDEIKTLIKNGSIKMNDTDERNRTLLHHAAMHGNYEIAKLCINLGADIYHEGKLLKEKTAMDVAIASNQDHIAQLLALAQDNSDASERIQKMSQSIMQQNSIIENMLKSLSLIGEQSKEIYIKSTQEMIMDLITKRLVFSDDLLVLCWRVEAEKGDPLQSPLWKTIEGVCKEIIDKKSKRDWFFLKQCILTSNIWQQPMKKTEEKYDEKTKDEDVKNKLYYKLLDLVDGQAQKGLDNLEKDLKVLEKQNQNDWTSLVEWNIPKKGQDVRQDTVQGGLKSRYSHDQLLQRTTAKFDSVKFYDYNQYLAELVLLAQIVDDEFQRSMRNIFNIDRITNMGSINNNNITFSSGPIKLVERARAKAANDYLDRKYPTSACVLDFNRCTLIFNDIKTMLAAIKLFGNKIKGRQAGNIIDIARYKNGFTEYVEDGVQYADIKLNVLIKGETNNIIGEVQFLLQRMKDFKDTAHNLYAIQREEEFISGAVKNVLPMLLDLDKQRNISVLNDNIKGVCNVMVFGNKADKDIISIDKAKKQSILQQVCAKGNIKMFKFMKSLMTDQELVDRVFLSSGVYNQTPLEEAIQLQRYELAEYILKLECVQNKLKEKDTKIIWRLLFFICGTGNKSTMTYIDILNSIGISKQDLSKYFKWRHPATKEEFTTTAFKYDQFTITNHLLVGSEHVSQLKKLVSIFGDKLIGEDLLRFDGKNFNGIISAIFMNRLEAMKYMLKTFSNVKQQCLKNMNMRWLIVFFVRKRWDVSTKDLRAYLRKELKFDKKALKQIVAYKYPKPNDTSYLTAGSYVEYWNEKMPEDAAKAMLM